jgi:hypothetical protein
MLKISHNRLKKLICVFLMSAFLIPVFPNIVSALDKQTSAFSSEPTVDGEIQKGDPSYPPQFATDVHADLTYIEVGQAYMPGLNWYYRWRGYVSFDTSSIPNQTRIISARLKLKMKTDNSDTDFVIKIMGGEQPLFGDNLEANEWGCGDSTTTTWDTANYPGDDVYIDVTIPKSQINKAGRTQFELKSRREGIRPDGNEYVLFYSGDSAGNEPKLEVTYYTIEKDWSKRRPSATTFFNETIASYAHNEYSSMSLSADVYKYWEDCPLEEQDELTVRVVGAANTHYGVNYAVKAGDGDVWLGGEPIGITQRNSGEWIDLPLPFIFTYYGAHYDRVWLCSNGFISFTDDNFTDYIQGHPKPNAIIAPFCRDLDPEKGGAIRAGEGPGHEQFTISWDHVPNHSNENEQSFEISLFLDSSFIFRYGEITKDEATTIGIEDQAGEKVIDYDMDDLSCGYYIEFTPQKQDARIDYLRIKASKPASGDTSAIIGIQGVDDAYPGGTNVALKETVDGKYLDAMECVGDIAVDLIDTFYAPIGLLCSSGKLLATLLSPAELNPDDVYLAGTGDSEAYATGWGADEEWYEWWPYDASFAVLIRWTFYDANDLDHDLKITFELNATRSEADISTSVDLHMHSNDPPNTPSRPAGLSYGYKGHSYSYSTSATDPENDDVYYRFYWGDGTNTTIGPFPSGTTASTSHAWSSTGTYTVQVKAQDTYGAWSGFSPSRTVTIYSGGGGGCPILFVWDGMEYVCEGLLDIHDPNGTDIVTDHTLVTTPKRVRRTYRLRLTEHSQTISHIDQVNLYAILEDKTLVELPLVWAWHSEDGYVLPQLLFSDDWKTDTLGADHNNGTSQSIHLRFLAPLPNMKVTGFLFVIEGNNMILKR